MSEPIVNQPNTRRLRDDRGFMIIEVLVSALILLMVSLAVFSALDNADRAAGNQQRRAVAANFVQSELERIRSLPVEDIAALRGTRKLTRDGINFEITTTAKWVSDGDDEPKCTSRTGGLDYMRTTVSIKWDGMGQAKPVTFTSLFTPTAGAGGDTGSLSVRLINRSAGPVANVPITLDGPSSYTETTNKNGCVIFAFVPESLDYELRFARAGFVDEQSVNQVKITPVTVTARETTKLQFMYDSGGFTKINFVTREASGTANTVPTAPPAFQMFHAEQRSPGITTELTGGATSWDGTNRPWFPFLTPYAIYAGNCQKNLPPSGNFANKMVNITPLAMQNAGSQQLPALGVVVRNGRLGQSAALTTPVTDATVEVDADCQTLWQEKTGSDGMLLDKGIPYTQTLRICAGKQGVGEVMYKNAIPAVDPWVQPSLPLYFGGDNGAGQLVTRAYNGGSCFN